MTKRELQDSFDALAIVAAELLVAAQDHKGLSADLDKCFWACIRGTKIEPKVVHVLTRPKPETQKTGADRLAEACGIYPSKKNMIVYWN